MAVKWSKQSDEYSGSFCMKWSRPLYSTRYNSIVYNRGGGGPRDAFFPEVNVMACPDSVLTDGTSFFDDRLTVRCGAVPLTGVRRAGVIHPRVAVSLGAEALVQESHFGRRQRSTRGAVHIFRSEGVGASVLRWQRPDDRESCPGSATLTLPLTLPRPHGRHLVEFFVVFCFFVCLDRVNLFALCMRDGTFTSIMTY